MKKFLSVLLFILCVSASINGQAKYVFYFIGDGMGLNTVNATEVYHAEMEGRIGVTPLTFTQFPIASYATTFSTSNGVTDSAAAGTALATGSKTNNGAIGVDASNTPVTSIAEKAKQQGMKVGITTTVSINHATPASFYAHRADRNMGYEIAFDLLDSNFDFFAGSGLTNPEILFDKTPADNIFNLIDRAGYTVVRGYDAFVANKDLKDKVILINKGEKSNNSIPYAIDRTNEDLTLAQITECAIRILDKDNNNGFFLMVEGGQIDGAAHANDAATTIHEIVDFDNAIKIAYQFYLQHPNETLIVVTADHDTGGIALGAGGYVLNLANLQYQKVSKSKLSSFIKKLRTNDGKPVTWEQVKEVLSANLGLWTKVPVTEEQEQKLYERYKKSFVEGDQTMEQTLYQSDEKLASEAIALLNSLARLGWASTSHSAAYVPVYAIGAGEELFKGKMDNTDIPLRILDAMGVEK
jgi:alkaline phosphatase